MAHGHFHVARYLFENGCQVSPSMLAGPPDPGSAAAPTRGSQDPILRRAQCHFHEATRGPADASPRLDLGPRWETYARWCRFMIPRFRTAVDAIHFAQDPVGHGGFEARHVGEDLAAYAAEVETHLMQRFPHRVEHFAGFSEWSLSLPGTTLERNGRLVSGPMFANMTFLLECLERLPPPQTVCEIGGGYGSPARLWLTNTIHRPGLYVIVDLPESLFFAEIFLRLILGPDAVYYISSAKPLDRAEVAAHQVLLCPVARMAALSTIHLDLVYNTLSMQEMSEECINHYMRWLDEQDCRFFYSFNYGGTPIEKASESMNVCAPRLSSRWHLLWVAPYAERPSPALHILAEKHMPEQDGEDRARGRRLFAEWFHTPCDRAGFVFLLEAAKLCDDGPTTLAIAEKALNELRIVPREMLFLLQLLQRQERSGPSVSADHSTRVAGLGNAVAARRRPELDGRVSPHLTVLREHILANSLGGKGGLGG